MRILLADDHPLFREALRRMVQRLDAAVEVLEARDYPELFERAREARDADLALVDLFMPGADRMHGIGAFRREFPDIPVIVLSAAEERDDARRALDDGALGFIPKSFSPELMLSAMRVVLAGGVFIPPLLRGEAEARAAGASGASLSSLLLRDFTQRQADVLRLVMRGHTNKSIARELGLAENTVKVHMAAVLKALGASSRTEAVLAAQRLFPGLAEP
jgi:DNA-binding NarL/FixJ family response regulator